MNKVLTYLAFIFSLAALIIILTANGDKDEEEIQLVIEMSHFQRFAEKLHFAGINENWELAKFYHHEVEETAEKIIEANIDKEGLNYSVLVKSMLVPSLVEVERAINKNNLEVFNSAYETMIKSCNNCHTSTNHGYIKIITPEKQTYQNQIFAK